MSAKILFVSSLPAERRQLKRMLPEYKVIAAPDFASAAKKIGSGDGIDIVLLDYTLPDRDILKFLREIKIEKTGKKLRTLLLTGDSELGKTAGIIAAGANDYLRRPFGREALRARIELQLEILRQKRLQAPQIEERNLLFRTILEQAPLGIVIARSQKFEAEPEDFVAEVNPMFEKITGFTQEEFNRLSWKNITHADDLAGSLEKFNLLQEGKINDYGIEKRYVRKDGRIIWVQAAVASIKLTEGPCNEYLCLVQDITERKEAETALAESERSKSVLLAHLPGMAYRCRYDREWTMQFVSAGCRDLTGFRPESLLGNRELSFNDVIAPEYRELLWEKWREMLKEGKFFRHEYEIITAEGTRKWVLELGQGIADAQGGIEALEGIIIDITKEKKAMLALKYVTEHDYLTGAYNRRFLRQLLSKEDLALGKRKRAVIVLVLNKLEALSLTYGQLFSESVIKELGNKLLAAVGEDKRLFRIAAGSFAFFVEDYRRLAELKDFCKELLAVMEEMPIMRIVGGSIGVMPIKATCPDMEKLLRSANAAAAKAAESEDVFAYRFVDERLLKEINREETLKELLLRVAAVPENDEINLVFQPVFNLATNEVEGFEALARLRSKALGEVSPGEFIPLAEKTQLMVPIGLQIMRQACAFLKEIENMGLRDIKLAVNISAMQLFRKEFLEDLLKAVGDAGVNAGNLILEITESIFLHNYDDMNARLAQLRKKGIKIAIDDFGVGYSSLARESELNVDYLKLDKYFLDKLLTKGRRKSIARDIIAMAHRLGHRVVAEGVEKEEQREYLARYGCDLYQGYLASRPLNSEAALELLRQAGRIPPK